MGIIYKLISPSKKVYIGQTIQSLGTRLSSHKYEAIRKNSNRKLSKAIRKYIESRTNGAGWIKTPEQLENLAASQRLTWLVTSPDGIQETITNLPKYCKEHNLLPTSLRALAYGRTRKSCFGYKLERVGD